MNSLVKMSLYLSSGEFPGGQENDGHDIERWENDGGSSLTTKMAQCRGENK